jgi:hypothetical protein
MSMLLRVTIFLGVIGCTNVFADDPVNTASADRIAVANAEKAEWEAKKARLEFENSAGPASGLTGAVTAQANAGTMEAQILMAQALGPISEEIVKRIREKLPADSASMSPIVIFTGNSGVDLSRWDLFRFRTDRLIEEYDGLTSKSNEVDTEYDKLFSEPSVVQPGEKDRSALLGAAALQSLSKIFSYAQSDYTVAPVSIDKDDSLLASAVLEKKGSLRVFMPSLLPQIKATEKVFEKIDDLSARLEERLAWVERANKRVVLLKSRIAKKPSNTSALNTLSKDYDALIVRAGVAETHYTALLTALSSSAADNPMSLGLVVREKAISDALGANGYGLFVVMSAASGASYTKKNLWTSFGAMPFFVSGGAVAHFKLVARDSGEVSVAGVVAYGCGYRKVSDVVGATILSSCQDLDEASIQTQRSEKPKLKKPIVGLRPSK